MGCLRGFRTTRTCHNPVLVCGMTDLRAWTKVIRKHYKLAPCLPAIRQLRPITTLAHKLARRANQPKATKTLLFRRTRLQTRSPIRLAPSLLTFTATLHVVLRLAGSV